LRPDDLTQLRQLSPPVPAEDVLLVIASSVPSMLQPNTVDSLSSETTVEDVSVCIVRDFFNTDACAWAAAGLTG
jgi:hypothetical protein